MHESSRFQRSSSRKQGTTSRRTISTTKRSALMSEERRLSHARGGSSIRFEDEVLAQQMMQPRFLEEPNFNDKMDKSSVDERSNVLSGSGPIIQTLR